MNPFSCILFLLLPFVFFELFDFEKEKRAFYEGIGLLFITLTVYDLAMKELLYNSIVSFAYTIAFGITLFYSIKPSKKFARIFLFTDFFILSGLYFVPYAFAPFVFSNNIKLFAIDMNTYNYSQYIVIFSGCLLYFIGYYNFDNLLDYFIAVCNWYIILWTPDNFVISIILITSLVFSLFIIEKLSDVNIKNCFALFFVA